MEFAFKCEWELNGKIILGELWGRAGEDSGRFLGSNYFINYGTVWPYITINSSD